MHINSLRSNTANTANTANGTFNSTSISMSNCKISGEFINVKTGSSETCEALSLSVSSSDITGNLFLSENCHFTIDDLTFNSIDIRNGDFTNNNFVFDSEMNNELCDGMCTWYFYF